MKIYMNEKKEGVIAILAAFFVLFSAMICPLVSAIIAIAIISGTGIWEIINK
ncbi:MAG: hypothetical protein KAR25_00265 [Methanosarcinales archaeon]|nr:hypothetical protein [Methanosarcinales archaeon]